MREIKFRGLNDETGEWVYGWYTKLVEGTRRFCAIIAEIDGTLTRFYIHDTKTIGQYTGLLDKNGKEIYEGDVLTPYRVVKYQMGYFYPFCSNESHLSSNFEVIGNVYENPELLGGVE